MPILPPYGPGDPFGTQWTPSSITRKKGNIPRGTGEDAFNLREVSERHPKEFTPDPFFNKRVSMNVRVVRAIDARRGQFLELSHNVEFEGGDDEEEFWDNYHEAVREAIAADKQEAEDFFDDNNLDVDVDDTSEGAGVIITGMVA